MSLKSVRRIDALAAPGNVEAIFIGCAVQWINQSDLNRIRIGAGVSAAGVRIFSGCFLAASRSGQREAGKKEAFFHHSLTPFLKIILALE